MPFYLGNSLDDENHEVYMLQWKEIAIFTFGNLFVPLGFYIYNREFKAFFNEIIRGVLKDLKS